MTAADTRRRRRERLRAAMSASGVALTAIAPTDNLRWLIGFAPIYDERACLLLVADAGEAMLMPSLNAEQMADRAQELTLVRWADEDGPEAALRAALGAVSAGDGGRIAVDPLMRADHLLMLSGALPQAQVIDAATVIGPLREIKDATELATLQRSSDIADGAVQAAWAACAPGATELEIADAITRAFSEAGAQPEFSLVGSGPNGAFPHHESGGRVLQEGDAVVIDLGGVLEGYHSDITRMAFVGEPTDRYREVHGVVEGAVAAAMAVTRPGATCGEIDAAARGVIADAGFGECFVHRTGHGLGLSGHEPPYLMHGSEVVLQAGMVHSIEPGIYLAGDFGVRLEEIVAVTEAGCEHFSALPRDVHVAA